MRTTLSMEERTYERVRMWAEQDGVSMNQWMVAAIDREDTRRRCEAHNDWLEANPDVADLLDEQDRIAEQRIAEASRKDRAA